MRETYIPQFDAETYLLWESRQEGRFELHHGFIVAFAGGTKAHATICFNVLVALERLYPHPCQTFGSDLKVQVNATTFYYPDASVVCAAFPDDATSTSEPRVVAEVLSKTTRGYDLVDKRAAYRAVPSLRAYIIVHTAVRRIEIDISEGDRSWRTLIYDVGSAPLGSGSLVLDDVYRNTEIAEA